MRIALPDSAYCSYTNGMYVVQTLKLQADIDASTDSLIFLEFGPGTFEFDRAIKTRDKTLIVRGTSSLSTTLSFSPVSADEMILFDFFASTATFGFDLRDVSLVLGKDMPITYLPTAINVVYSSLGGNMARNVNISDVQIKSLSSSDLTRRWETGIHLSKVYNPQIVNILFSGAHKASDPDHSSQNGIILVDVVDAVLDSCRIYEVVRAIRLTHWGETFNITNCFLIHCFFGVVSSPGAGERMINALVQNCHINVWPNGAAVQLTRTHDSSVTNNHLQAQQGGFVQFIDSDRCIDEHNRKRVN